MKQVLADRAERVDELIASGRQIDMIFKPGQKVLSLRAQKLWHLLVKAAGVDLASNTLHRIPLGDLYDIGHMPREQRVETLRELQTTLVEVRVPSPKVKGGVRVISGALLSHVARDEDDRGELEWEFSKALRTVFANSEHWAVLSKRAVMAFESRYALRLYELIALRAGLDHKTCETFPLEELRARLGVPVGKLARWQDLKVKVLEVASAEVNQLAGFRVSYEPVKRGRAVAAVKLSWEVKSAPERRATKLELDQPRVGRKARRDGSAETVAVTADRLSFPASGGIEYEDHWKSIKQAAGCNMDNDLIATKFREWCATRATPIRLDARNIDQIFRQYCENIGQV
jgi:hypothetical protein